MMNTKRLSYIAILTALSTIGAMIKIPAVIGSVALDIFPALIAGATFGSLPGAIVAGFGHMISAMLGGMLLGPLHILVAIEMGLLVFLFSILFKKINRLAASLIFILGNTFLAPIPFLFIIGTEFYISILPALFIGSVMNTIMAVFVIKKLDAIRNTDSVIGMKI